MESRVNLKALKINGQDPRLSKTFLLLSSELSHLNGALPGKIDWGLLEKKCYLLFREYGFDLQSGVWFCLINLRLNSWKGLALALDLLSTAFINNGLRCWPPVSAVQQRQHLIDWFCANVATHIYTLEYGPENNSDMWQVERNIAVLCEQAKNLQSRSHESLNNLRYFMQVRCRSVPYPKNRIEKVAEIEPFSTVEQKNTPMKVKADLVGASECQWPEIKLLPAPESRPILWLLSGLGVGVILSLIAFGIFFYSQQPDVSEKLTAPLAQLQHTDNQLNTVWKATSAKEINGQKKTILAHAMPVIQWLSQQSADSSLRQGNTLSRRLRAFFPDNPVSDYWDRSIQEKLGDIPALDGYINANKHLNQLEAHLLNAEKEPNKYMTLSELKTAVYQIRQDLQQNGVPAETLLAEIQQERLNGEKVDPSLLKQTSQRIDSLSAIQSVLNEQ